jgi:hypothetical protein
VIKRHKFDSQCPAADDFAFDVRQGWISLLDRPGHGWGGRFEYSYQTGLKPNPKSVDS